MRSSLNLAVAASALLTAALIPATGHAASNTHPGNAGCAVPYIIGQQICYSPSHVAQAEKQVPWAIRPDSAMKLTFGLKLSQVSVVKFPGTPTVTQIDYLYGPLRHDYGRQGASPFAIRITESQQRVNERVFRLAWTSSVCGAKVEISPAANPDQPHPNYGPWYLIGNFPNGKGAFAITGNAGKAMLQTLACRMIR